MPSENAPDRYEAIQELLDTGDFEEARRDLSTLAEDDNRAAVLQIKLALYEGTLEPGAAMQRLIQLMRRDPDWPLARALYQEASNLAYQSRKSSVSHSHPPPPSDPRKPGS